MTLVFVETDKEKKVKKNSLEAIAYARAIDENTTAVVLGAADPDYLKGLGKYGAQKVVCIPDERLNRGIAKAYAIAIAKVMEQEGANVLVLANSLLGTHVAARVAARLGASFAPNVVELPDTTSGFVVKQSIYSGKAFVKNELKNEKKVIAINKNTIDPEETQNEAEVLKGNVSLTDADFDMQISTAKETGGGVLLSEAAIIVSGGRGMKGPEHWSILEELATTLGAALGCSKPVSDMGWRPHHEHVGQTGVKVSPQLYIAVGISGAIQHVAGVNSSKCIVVINKDAEAPFFKAADYGIVGDAFEVIPKLITAIKAS